MTEVASLPDGWKIVSLEDVVTILDRFRIPLNATERAGRPGSYPYYGANGQVDSIDDYIFEGKHILLAEDGGHFDDPSKPVAYVVDGRFWVNNHAHVLAPHAGIPPEFVELTLNSQNLMPYVGGSTRLKLTQGKMRRIRTPLPPLAEQLRIVDKVRCLQEKTQAARDALDEIPPLLDKFRRSVLASAFRGDLTADWRARNPNVEPASVLLERILAERRRRWEEEELAKMEAKGKVPKNDKWKSKYKEPVGPNVDELPELPEGWSWATVDQLGEVQGGIQKGKRRKPGTELVQVPYLRVANVQRGFLDLDEVLEIGATELELEKLRLRPGDILFNEGGDRDKLGRGWVWQGEIDPCIHQNHVFRLRLFEHSLESELISWYGNSSGKEYFLKEGKQTTNLASLNSTKLRSLPVPLIPIREQQALVETISRLLDCQKAVASVEEQGRIRIDLLEQAILHKAFEGRLVPQDPNDEPASVLLERIRREREAAEKASKKRK